MDESRAVTAVMHDASTRRAPRFWIVSCRACGTRLAIGTDHDQTVALAARNRTARPCCLAAATEDR